MLKMLFCRSKIKEKTCFSYNLGAEIQGLFSILKKSHSRIFEFIYVNISTLAKIKCHFKGSENE